MSEEFLRSTTRDDEHLRIVHDLEFTSYLCVPLTARGRILGALTLVSSGSGRRFSVDDLAALAEEFAAARGPRARQRAGSTPDRDHVARALQASLLPPSLPRIPGVEVAARYVAAGEGNEVGGDFYDVFQVRRNNWCFLVGDVSGKGPEAAAIAGLARHTLRAAAILAAPTDADAADTPRGDAQRRGVGRSVLHCLLRAAAPNRAGVDLRVSCGGHPLPFIARADGTVENLDCRGTLLGLAHPCSYRTRRCSWPGRCVRALHRRRDRSTPPPPTISSAKNGWARSSARAPRNPRTGSPTTCSRPCWPSGPREPADDVAILVAKVDPRVT